MRRFYPRLGGRPLEVSARGPFGASGDHLRINPGQPRRLAQKGRFAVVGLDQGDIGVGHDGEDEPGKTAAAADIGDGFGLT